MDIQLLKVFYTAAQESNISKAANKLNFAQSNVTHKIQQLESDLQTQLFYRHNRGITLSPSGQILLPYVEKILHVIQEARSAVESSAVPTGTLHIGSLETAAAIRLPALLTQYHTHYPAVDLSLITGPSEQHLHALLHYELNGAFVTGPVVHPELVQEDVVTEELVLVAPVSHPPIHSIQDIKLLTFLVFHKGCSYRAKLEHLLLDEGLSPVKFMEFGSFEAIIGCVGAGLGIALLPRSIINEAEQQGRIRCHEISRKHAMVKTVFVRRKDALITPALSAFLSEMKEHFH
ncbi:LysR family transcriptional regulator [Paenibacillus sp. RC67]|uniref:LysR family transcriptional regulator n=1 Tax=Paenibacillus sp. RC67 TaxID=3039392 RepID=UPI0024AE3B99|nr:LysR family transcriptional regulator [Paenibacillus sp. RC67]